ncbi:hypothetical protein KI387_011913, partial [Taxus chinensis]
WTAPFHLLMVVAVAVLVIAIKSRSTSKGKKYPPGVGAWTIMRDLVLHKDK